MVAAKTLHKMRCFSVTNENENVLASEKKSGFTYWKGHRSFQNPAYGKVVR